MGTNDFQAAERIGYAVRHTPLGWILVARSDRGICAILLGDSAEALAGDLRDRFRVGGTGPVTRRRWGGPWTMSLPR